MGKPSLKIRYNVAGVYCTECHCSCFSCTLPHRQRCSALARSFVNQRSSIMKTSEYFKATFHRSTAKCTGYIERSVTRCIPPSRESHARARFFQITYPVFLPRDKIAPSWPLGALGLFLRPGHDPRPRSTLDTSLEVPRYFRAFIRPCLEPLPGHAGHSYRKAARRDQACDSASPAGRAGPRRAAPGRACLRQLGVRSLYTSRASPAFIRHSPAAGCGWRASWT